MDAFVWNERYLTGIDSIDQQHRGLVRILNRVGTLAEDERLPAQSALDEVFQDLIGYAHRHFSTEERLMNQGGCDARHVSSHRQEHAVFLKQVQAMSVAGGADTHAALRALLTFLASWLAYHILGADHSMARQMAAIRAGRSPEEAFAEESATADRASEALLAALGNLVGLVASRNMALGEAQEMLRRANLQLEAKVEARTHELERANGELTAMVERLETTQDQLLQSEKLAGIGLLAAGVAHEINNPVGFVNSNLGTLKRYVDSLLRLIEAYEASEPALPAAARARLAAIRQEADLEFLRTDVRALVDESREGLDRVTRIVQDLKEFSRVDKGEWALADLNKGMESTLNVVWNELKYKADVVREYGTLPPLMCLPAQLNQVFLNLLVNAAHAIEGRGVITVRSGCTEDSVWMEVGDTGCGMSTEVQRRVFDPFFTTKPVGKGTGLGMSLAYGIVQKHNGRIELDSAPGEGSVFRLWLPRAQPAGAAAAGPAGAAGAAALP